MPLFDTKLRPFGDRILVKRIPKEERSAGGIVIPDSAKEKPQMGAVLAVGTGKRDAQGNNIPMHVQKGDTVFFGKYAGTELEDDYVIIREDEILGVVEK